MLSRGIERDDALAVFLRGEPVEDYPTAFPFPAGLFASSIGTRMIHVVAAWDGRNREVYVISVYEPDREHFETDLKTRRRKP